MNFMDIQKLGIMSSGDVCDYLNVGHATFAKLVRNYEIPHVATKAGMIFLKNDIDAFQESRKENMKYRNKLRKK